MNQLYQHRTEIQLEKLLPLTYVPASFYSSSTLVSRSCCGARNLDQEAQIEKLDCCDTNVKDTSPPPALLLCIIYHFICLRAAKISARATSIIVATHSSITATKIHAICVLVRCVHQILQLSSLSTLPWPKATSGHHNINDGGNDGRKQK